MRHGTNHENTKDHNRRVILEVIRLHDAVSRAEIARHTSLTAQTVSNIVEDLLADGVVLTRGRRQGQRGQPALELEFNPNGAFSVGLHLDRDLLTAVLVNLKGESQRTTHHRIEVNTPETAYPIMRQAVEELIAEQGIAVERVWGVGLALPGPVRSPKGEQAGASTVENWVRDPVRDLLERELRLSVLVENDATAAAIGEYWYAAHRTARGFFYLYFGLGLGGGMIHEGQPYRGFAGNAIEIGHVPVQRDGPLCQCGGRGCLELYASQKSLLATLRKAKLNISSESDLDDLLEQCEPHLVAWLDRAAEYLAIALVGVENLFDPEAIVLGGRLPVTLLEALISRLERLISPLRMTQKSYRPPLVCAEIGVDAAALGAATLPIFEMLAPTNPQTPKASLPVLNGGGGEAPPPSITASSLVLRQARLHR